MAVPVGRETADALVARLKLRIGGLKVGPGTDPDAEMGPLITAAHRQTVENYIALGVEEGELVTDGRGLKLQAANGFSWVRRCSTVSRPDMRIYRDEIFGPVLSVVRREGFDDAMDLVNAEYGNGRSSPATAKRRTMGLGLMAHGRYRTDPRADGVSFRWWLESFAVWRISCPWSRVRFIRGRPARYAGPADRVRALNMSCRQ